MRNESDDDLDLSTWDAPPAPVGLADAVVARLAERDRVEHAFSAAPPAMPVEHGRLRARRWVSLASAAAALAAGVAIAVIAHGTEREGPTSGHVVATNAQTLTLRGAHGELDPGTQVTWHRGGDGALHVEQPAGSATWRVERGSRLWIDAGATVASIEAAGASLRVEVKMNKTDARVIAASALTAGIVSAVTVTVYEGYVKAGGSHGQTVIVQPGSTYTVTPEPAPVRDGVDLHVVAGEPFYLYAATFPVTAEVDVPAGCKLAVDEREQPSNVFHIDAGTGSYAIRCANAKPIEAMWSAREDSASHELIGPDIEWLAFDGRRHDVVAPSSLPSFAYDVAGTVWFERDGKRQRFEQSPVPTGALEPGTYTYGVEGKPTVSTLRVSVGSGPVFALGGVTWDDGGRDHVEGVVLAGSTLSIDNMLVPVEASGHFTASVPGAGTHALRIASSYRGINYYILRKNGLATVPANPSLPATLDGDAVAKIMEDARPELDMCAPGRQMMSLGQKHGTVVVVVKVAPDGHPTDVALDASYNSQAGECVRRVTQGLTFPATRAGGMFKYPVKLTSACSADALKEDGLSHVAKGEHAQALAKLEESLACRDDAYVVQLAFMEACASHNAPKAQLFFKRLAPEQQTKLMEICIRQSPPIDPQGGPQGATAAPPDGMGMLHATAKPATAKIFIDGVDTGMVGTADVPVAPGKHKISFEVGSDKYTYPFVIEAGATATVSKDLQ